MEPAPAFLNVREGRERALASTDGLFELRTQGNFRPHQAKALAASGVIGAGPEHLVSTILARYRNGLLALVSFYKSLRH